MSDELYSTYIKLIRSGKRISTAIDRKLKDRKITLVQGEVILALAESGPARPIDLATQVFVNKASLVPMIERLERQGLVRRQKNKEDHRSHFVALTELGLKRSVMVADAMKEIAEELSKGISRTEVSVLEACLEKIFENIDGDQK